MKPSVCTFGGKEIPFHALHGDVRFESVEFCYPARPSEKVLRNFSLHIPAGKVVALCGPSGAGKSTVAALLDRFYDIESGSIQIDGIDVRDLDSQWLRGRTIGVISQVNEIW